MPKPDSGLSLQPLPEGFRQRPLFSAQAISARLLSSTYRGFLARNWSAQSKPPSSGSATGTTSSRWPASGAAATSQSAAAASRSMRQLKGSLRSAGSAKLRRSAAPRMLIVGNSARFQRLSGSGCGSVTRTPLRKRLRVLALGLAGSRFSSMPMTCSAASFCPTRFFDLPWMKKPSASKQTPSSPSPRRRDEPAVEKPRRTCWAGCRCWACGCATGGFARITASNM
mmetsp:Transcript_28921/g.90035  ORF Transcript_28921/g.90035 Transcript_28921/m.90035 type:complete len:226 (+) Transcript_28921:466-1143(+)